MLRDVAEPNRFVIPEPSSRPRWKLAGDWHGVHALAWSPDGASLAAAIGRLVRRQDHRDIRIWDTTELNLGD